MKLHTKRKAFIQIVWVSPQPSLTGLPSETSIQESVTIWGYSGFAIRKAPRKQKCQKHWNASTESAYLNRKAGERLSLLKIYTKFHEYYNFVCVRFPSFLTLMDCLNQPNISVKMSQVAEVLHAQRRQVYPHRQIPSLPTGRIEMTALLLNNNRY